MKKTMLFSAIALLLSFLLLSLPSFAAEIEIISEEYRVYNYERGAVDSGAGMRRMLPDASVVILSSPDYRYYNQLNPNQKAMYDALKDMTHTDAVIPYTLPEPIKFISVSNPLTPEEDKQLKALLQTVTQTAIDAMIADCMDLFWLSIPNSYSGFQMSGKYVTGGIEWTITTLNFYIHIKPQYQQGIEQVFSSFLTAIDDFTAQGATRYQILKSIHDQLCQTVEYVENPNHCYEPYGALVVGEAVCEGYSEAYKLLCEKYDIPCVLAMGDGITPTDSGPHMWNYVQMEDGNWYAVDVTWDDQPSAINYEFFLVGSQTLAPSFGSGTFFDSHLENGDFSRTGIKTFLYPPLSASKYLYEILLLGDADQNGIISMHDVAVTLQIAAGHIQPSETLRLLCDINGDDTVNASDALLILKYITQLPVEYAIGQTMER